MDWGRTWIMSTEAFCIFVVDAARLDRDGKTFRKPSGIVRIFCQKAKKVDDWSGRAGIMSGSELRQK